ncbi:MAG: GNAT family N-acetyltransferase [Robiginitomaculum sp.]|nr:MAG: GNAT family N-acetyltransferase [Robiginitomaculum sp.]
MINDVLPIHHAEILRNNLAFVDWLSPLDHVGLFALLAASCYARQISNGAGVLIGFTSDSAYQSKNLTWLRAKFANFVYIDRVIIGAKSQGRGYGRLLYEDFEAFAHENGYTRLVCEVNTKPDNPGSHLFHQKLGFTPCGDMGIASTNKCVRYYEKQI